MCTPLSAVFLATQNGSKVSRCLSTIHFTCSHVLHHIIFPKFQCFHYDSHPHTSKSCTYSAHKINHSTASSSVHAFLAAYHTLIHILNLRRGKRNFTAIICVFTFVFMSCIHLFSCNPPSHNQDDDHYSTH